MRHRRFTLLSAVSLLLCVAMVGLWVRSHWVADGLAWASWAEADGKLIQGRLAIVSSNGYLLINKEKLLSPINAPSPWPNPGLSYSHARPGWRATGSSFWNRLGFGLPAYRLQTPGVDDWLCVVPQWAIAVPLIALTLPLPLRLRRIRIRQRRARRGQCANCGYDLRATPDRCPECGAVAAGTAMTNPAPTAEAGRRA
jgi:hypothetical protein